MNNTKLAATLLAATIAGLGTGLAAGLTGGTVAGAADVSGPPARTTSKVHVLHFLERVDPRTNKDIDLGETGFSVGDQQVFRDPLTRGGHQIGTAQGYGEITYLTKTQLGITGVATADLGNGALDLRFSAVEDLASGPARTSVSAVTGGTGSYAGATGQCTSTRIGDS